MTPRTVVFTEAAKRDVLWTRLSKNEWAAVKSELYRIAGIENVRSDSAVNALYVCEGSDWLRLKITQPSQIRIAFTVEQKGTQIVVHALLRRGERTYDQFQIIWEAAA